ncbi:MAG: hypothetical protein KatS3mg033_0991 [Thermonema sp.]|uniref:HU domain-containing protein n=1 Tax=Thermonema sp. TaxID=2231181 RepID=UPI0021DD174E|nr:SPOR domain-containing protein [Thermonema sp.]GIV39191.1 MAG: hypothetical protein KatS3mg033_0991 [Thermonema sp.]
MEEVIKTIKETLYRYGQVCLPELGCLQVKYQGAKIHAAIHKISPPSGKIVFTADKQSDSHHLKEALQQQTGLPAGEIESILKNLSTAIKIELGTHKKFTIPELGTFKLQYDESIEFEQDPEVNYLPDAFGLPEVFGQVVVRTEEEEAALQQQLTEAAGGAGTASLHEDTPLAMPSQSKRNWGGIIVVASLFLIALFASYVLFIDPSLNPFNALFGSEAKQNATKNTAEPAVVANEETNTGTNDEASTEEETMAEPVPLDTESSVAASEEEENSANDKQATPDANTRNYEANNNTNSAPSTTQTQSTPTIDRQPAQQESYNKAVEFYTVNSPQNQYFIIAGSFTNKVHAYKAAEDFLHKGFKKTRVVVSDGRYRVAVGFEADKDKADSLRLALQQRLGKNDLWILRY